MRAPSRSAQAWLPYRKAKPEAGARLFCFPHAGGAASIFRDWGERLPAHIEVCGVQLPGREARLMETPFTSMTMLVDELVGVLEPLFDRPFALFGYSLGAAVACELARRLGSAAQLYVCARRPPHLPSRLDPVYLLPERAFADKLRALGGTPEEALNNAELLELILPTLRADFELNDTYLAAGGEMLNCPIHAFGGVEDTEVSEGDLRGWEGVTSGPFRLRMFSGGHFFLKPNLGAILGDIGGSLAGRARVGRA